MTNPSTAHVPVLIIGGGPTGTTLAIELLRRGVSCRIIDRLDQPVATSRSFTLHARTLELFEMAGFVDRFVERGLRSRSMDYRFQGVEEIGQLDFTQLESRYPFTLVINQNVTEEVLRHHLTALGGQIEWQTELQSVVRQDNGRLRTTLRHIADDREEVIETDWLIGCDGLHSIVRKQMDLKFEGDEYTGMEMKMMDVPLSGFPLGDDSIHYLISKERLLLITKLPGSNYRVLISDMGDARKTETARESFQLVLDDHFHGKVRLGEPEWATVFTIWRRISTGYRQGHIFLAGDAAHIHSPAGGQGMNACIQDAFNLGWKLALIVRGEAQESLLDTYERERRPIAQQVVEGTHLLHAVIMAHGTSIQDRLAITQAPGFNQRAVRQVSGVSYTYRNDIAVPPGLSPLDGLAAGDRAPDVRLTPMIRLYDLLRHPYYTLLLFQGAAGSTRAVQECSQHIAERYGARVRTQVITAPEQAASAPAGAIIAESDAAHRLYGGQAVDTVCLVRPDGYLGLRCRLADKAAIITALDSVLRCIKVP